jgi:hypothetical protein
MGVCVQSIFKRGPISDILEMNLSTGWVWVVIRRSEELNEQGVYEWHLQGVFDDEDKASGSCHDHTYLIGPLPLNTALPRDRIDWVGSYFPMEK